MILGQIVGAQVFDGIFGGAAGEPPGAGGQGILGAIMGSVFGPILGMAETEPPPPVDAALRIKLMFLARMMGG